MPIYEYRCPECGLQKEFLQRVGADPIATCPACGSGSFAKMLSAAGFHLKGSGWYATDFKSTATAKKSGEESKPESAKSDAAATPCGGSCSCH